MQKGIDDAGYDILRTAWDETDPQHRQLPTWRQLANAVKQELGHKGTIATLMTALKQRAPKTREKREQIAREIAQEKRARGR